MQEGAGGEGGIHLLLSILADGEEQARQLGELPDDPRLGPEHYKGATRQLQCTLGKAVCVAKAIEAASRAATDSPRSADEGSGGTAAAEAQERPGMCKRRKGLPRWTRKFRVPDARLEATPDDGFSWRKYGQKDILGAKFPRGYYRCTYRAAQGCLATKQVQRSDSDLCVFDVTYQGVHTCHQKQRHVIAAGASSPHDAAQPAPPPDPSMEELLIPGFKDRLKVETTAEASSLHASCSHDHDHAAAASPSSAPFSFHAGVVPADCCFPSSPAGSSYYAVPHYLVPAGSYDDYTGGYGVLGAESDELGEVVSRATAPVQAAAAAADLSAGFGYALYHHAEFDPHLPFAPSGGGGPHR
ncbi:hypothetical protein QOZ80_6AG0509550 [Eleusine coracana subsp. coracana]|nr:hypothetical protein QOZ80_6AG0509550 [Eleusine coracana subsp. coracana]